MQGAGQRKGGNRGLPLTGGKYVTAMKNCGKVYLVDPGHRVSGSDELGERWLERLVGMTVERGGVKLSIIPTRRGSKCPNRDPRCRNGPCPHDALGSTAPPRRGDGAMKS